MISYMLAQAPAPAPGPDGFGPEWVAGLIVAVVGGVVSAVMAHAKGKASGKEEAQKMQVSGRMKVAGDPTLQVQEKREPSWAEVAALDRRVTTLEDAHNATLSRVTALHVEMLHAGEKRSEELRAHITAEVRGLYQSIERMEAAGHQARAHIHDKVNANAREIAGLKARCDTRGDGCGPAPAPRRTRKGGEA